ncbi:MAG: ABC transporter permease [Ruminococcus sp.]|nr:ABC transporter permease [Ruminococcus sp.]
MKTKAFSIRNIKELLRDPMSWIFSLGFPIIMLIVMTVINESIPKTPASPQVFNIDQLTPGIAVFGLTFIMQFACIQVSKDRSSAFLTRLYASPMKSIDYIAGYTIPLIIIAIVQLIVCYLSGEVIALILGTTLDIPKSLFSILILIPSILLFIGLGLIIGTLFNDKAAPGITSIFITLAALLGGIWMDVETLGGTWKSICEILPFYHSVKSARLALAGNFEDMVLPLLICSAFAVAVYILAVIIFTNKIKKDNK